METIAIDTLRYPVGKFKTPREYTQQDIQTWITTIEKLPAELKEELRLAGENKLDVPYREGGWTVRQVVHHLADSHMNSYIRFKLSMTETDPTVRPYYEDRWAELTDAKSGPVEFSVNLLEALHQRWVYFLRSLTPADFQRRFYHPEHDKHFELREILALYAWHCQHHLGHVRIISRKTV